MGRDHVVEQRLGVALDRRERRLQLVAHRQQERLLGLPGTPELGRHVVERRRELDDLGGAALGERRLMQPRRQVARGVGDKADRPGDGARQHEGPARREQGPDDAGDQQRETEWPPVAGREPGRAQQHHCLCSGGLRGVEEAGAAHRHDPVRADPAQQRRPAFRRHEQRRLAQRQDRDPLVLRREERAELGEARVGRGLARLACGEHGGLAAELLERLGAGGVADEDEPDDEHQRDRRADGGRDRGEDARAKAAQAGQGTEVELHARRVGRRQPATAL